MRFTEHGDGDVADVICVWVGEDLENFRVGTHVAGAVKHIRAARHDYQRDQTFWQVQPMLAVPGLVSRDLRSIEVADEEQARAWLTYLARLAEPYVAAQAVTV